MKTFSILRRLSVLPCVLVAGTAYAQYLPPEGLVPSTTFLVNPNVQPGAGQPGTGQGDPYSPAANPQYAPQYQPQYQPQYTPQYAPQSLGAGCSCGSSPAYPGYGVAAPSYAPAYPAAMPAYAPNYGVAAAPYAGQVGALPYQPRVAPRERTVYRQVITPRRSVTYYKSVVRGPNAGLHAGQVPGVAPAASPVAPLPPAYGYAAPYGAVDPAYGYGQQPGYGY